MKKAICYVCICQKDFLTFTFSILFNHEDLVAIALNFFYQFYSLSLKRIMFTIFSNFTHCHYKEECSLYNKQFIFTLVLKQGRTGISLAGIVMGKVIPCSLISDWLTQ